MSRIDHAIAPALSEVFVAGTPLGTGSGAAGGKPFDFEAGCIECLAFRETGIPRVEPARVALRQGIVFCCFDGLLGRGRCALFGSIEISPLRPDGAGRKK